MLCTHCERASECLRIETSSASPSISDWLQIIKNLNSGTRWGQKKRETTLFRLKIKKVHTLKCVKLKLLIYVLFLLSIIHFYCFDNLTKWGTKKNLI